MNYRPLFWLVAIISAITFFVFSAWRRPSRLLIMLTAFSLSASAQNGSSILNSSRVVDWTQAGFTIPNYTSACPTQPSLTAGTGAASANATAISNALDSCDATHNVVNIPAGTWYVTNIVVQKGNVVLRGAGPNSTMLIPTAGSGCAGGQAAGICLIHSNTVSFGNTTILPGGAQACNSWSAGYAKDSTTLTLNGCGSAPPVNAIVGLDQANDTSDTNGIYICDDTTSNCPLETGGAEDGRNISGITHSQQQYTKITGVTSMGSGSYSVTISPGVYFTNIRSSQSPTAFWFDTLHNAGLENFSIDGSTMSSGSPTDHGNIGMVQCYQCWIKNVRSMNAGRYHVEPALSFQVVIRDSYFFGAMGGASQSYGIEIENTSADLIENNIFQQVTAPIMNGNGSGNVYDYNLALDDFYTSPSSYTQGAYFSHNAGNEMNLWEGNNFVVGPWGDIIHGSSAQTTVFRSISPGWYAGKTAATTPMILRGKVRAANIVGNIWGQPGYHTQYQVSATSSSAFTQGNEDTSIYSIGLASQGVCTVESVTNGCDPLTLSTLMRWGNYDTVNGSVQWNSTEAAPGAVPYLNANFTTSYFSSLAHTLPASLHYNSTPSWWPSGKAWPPIGPDVSSGNVGICTGIYAGAQATSSGQCTSGALTAAWASHVTSIPAQDCFLNVMHGPPDGTGNVLKFDAGQCYSSSSQTSGTGPQSPTGLTAAVI